MKLSGTNGPPSALASCMYVPGNQIHRCDDKELLQEQSSSSCLDFYARKEQLRSTCRWRAAQLNTSSAVKIGRIRRKRYRLLADVNLAPRGNVSLALVTQSETTDEGIRRM